MNNKFLKFYISEESILYGINPLIALIFCFSAAIISIISTGYTPLIILLLIFSVVFFISKIPMGTLLSFLWIFRFFYLFAFIFQIFFYDHRWQIPNIETVSNASFYTFRMFLVLLYSSFFVFIISPINIIRIFNFIFKPLSIFGVPSKDLALSMVIALRFIPLLFVEGQKIIDSKIVYGELSQDKQSMRRRVSNIISIIIPLFIRTYYYSSQIAITLRYKTNDRFFQLPKMKFYDILILLFTLSFFTVAIYFEKTN